MSEANSIVLFWRKLEAVDYTQPSVGSCRIRCDVLYGARGQGTGVQRKEGRSSFAMSQIPGGGLRTCHRSCPFNKSKTVILSLAASCGLVAVICVVSRLALVK
jgi:hypothetical protein